MYYISLDPCFGSKIFIIYLGKHKTMTIILIFVSSNKYAQEYRDPIAAGFALESFRSHDFDPISAICEIIDNSIEANADTIEVKFDWNDQNMEGNARYVKQFVFIDNGNGMDDKILYDYLILGESEKRALTKGIGKFGVGATLAGISQARRIDAYSKIRGGKWMYTFLDLDLVEHGKYVPKPIQKDPPHGYSKDLDGGTIVIWNNVDQYEFTEENVFPPTSPRKNQDPHNDAILATEVGRIYRKFLLLTRIERGQRVKNEHPVKITIQNVEVEPYDPLYITHNPKKNDQNKPIHKSKTYTIRHGSHSAKMYITVSYFPESWWVDPHRPGLDRENRVERKIGPRNEGITLVREGREIFFGRLPYFRINDAESTDRGAKSFLELDRYTGYEIEFGRDADEIFGIQVNKSKLNVRKEIRQEISNYLSPTFVTRRSYWHEKRGETDRKKKRGGAGSPDKGKKKIQSALNPEYDDKQKQFLQEVAQKYVKDKNDKEAIKEAYNDLVNGYLPIASYDLSSIGPLVNYEYELDSIIVKYNMNHPFLKKFTDALTEVGVKLGKNSENTLSVPENQTLRTLLDMFFVAFGLAKNSYPDLGKQQEIQATLNTLQTTWADKANECSRMNLLSD